MTSLSNPRVKHEVLGSKACLSLIGFLPQMGGQAIYQLLVLALQSSQLSFVKSERATQ